MQQGGQTSLSDQCSRLNRFEHRPRWCTIRQAHGRLAQLVRALRLHRRCQGFESLSDHHMKKIAFVLFLIVIASVVYSSIPSSFSGYPRRYIFINNQKINLIVADTEERKITGLSGVTKLKENEGMLFTFQNYDRYGFWMKDMKISLDFIYCRDRYVVEVLKNVKPNSYPHIFVPTNEFNAMIEMSAGSVDKIGVHVGDKVVYNDN